MLNDVLKTLSLESGGAYEAQEWIHLVGSSTSPSADGGMLRVKYTLVSGGQNLIDAARRKNPLPTEVLDVIENTPSNTRLVESPSGDMPCVGIRDLEHFTEEGYFDSAQSITLIQQAPSSQRPTNLESDLNSQLLRDASPVIQENSNTKNIQQPHSTDPPPKSDVPRQSRSVSPGGCAKDSAKQDGRCDKENAGARQGLLKRASSAFQNGMRKFGRKSKESEGLTAGPP